MPLKERDTRSLLSDTKFFEAYSRYNEALGKYETWEEAVTRVMDMHRGVFKEQIRNSDELREAIEKAEVSYKKKLFLGAQRSLQYGGEQIISHNMRLFNCVSSHLNRPAFFGEYFYTLLCGAGFGYSVQKHHVEKLPMVRPRTKQAKIHTIEDTIEGWATSLDVLLSSYFIGGGVHPEYEGRRVHFEFHKIRAKGSHISGGFKAPGPEPLKKALDKIETLLNSIAENGILRPIDVYDICCHAADAVLSGGIRRAATLALFSKDDQEMMTAKTGDWFLKNPQRARSNNSVALLRETTTLEDFLSIIKNIREYGEPGFVFLSSLEHTFNPCLEISKLPVTEDGEYGLQGCNLCELNGSLCSTPELFFEACESAAVIGTLQAAYTNFKFVGKATKKIFDREALLGVSITGWMNNPNILFDEKTLKKGAQIVKDTNKKIAKLIGINPAARTTCVKPSGNSGVLLGTASGIHPEHSKKYIRNVQINKQEEISDIIKETNPYMIEESVWSSTNSDNIISFPLIPPKNTIFKKSLSAIEFLDKVKFAQQHWVENGTEESLCTDPSLRHNVSNTVVVNDDEWEQVAEYLFQNKDYFTGVSLLPSRGDKDYYQAPMIEVKTPEEIVKEYGSASIFASGLIVDSNKGFKHLWEATMIAQQEEDDSSQEIKDIRSDWIRRFKKFATNYFDGDLKQTEYCLKDVYILFKWTKIQSNFQEINISELLHEFREKDINTMGAQTCYAGSCEV